jgi:hypothetical protein
MTLRLAGLACVAALFLAGSAVASAASSRAASAVVRDCTRHDGALASAHSVSALKAARKLARTTRCSDAIATQLAELTGRRGSSRAGAVLKDCTATGRLTRSYPAATLRRAKKQMPIDVRDYSNCPQMIRSALAVAAHRHPRR